VIDQEFRTAVEPRTTKSGAAGGQAATHFQKLSRSPEGRFPLIKPALANVSGDLRSPRRRLRRAREERLPNFGAFN